MPDKCPVGAAEEYGLRGIFVYTARKLENQC
jgi:hypothetical protein